MMKKAEVSFPRGKLPKLFLGASAEDSTGKTRKKKSSTSGDTSYPYSTPSNKNTNSDDLFKVTHALFDGASKKRKKRSGVLTSDETDLLSSGDTGNKTKSTIDVLSYETITEGMLSLGRVIKVRDHEILVSLPGRTMGSVPITSISAPYTKALETLTADGNTEDPVYGVDDLFVVGQVVTVAVVGVKRDGHSVRVTLSMAPNDVQSSYSPGSIAKSMILTGAVSSVEDHGYIMDVGIPGTSAFLPKANATAFIQHQNKNKPLGIGQLVKCKVLEAKAGGKSGTSKCYLTLTINSKEVNQCRVTLETITSSQLLLPGTESEGTVMETHKTGLKVDFLNLVGHIHLDHMTDPWTLPGSIEIGATIYPRVLYTLPNSTTPALTLQTSLCQKRISVQVPSLTLGSKLKVKVARIEKRGIIVKFQNGERGFVSSTRCSDNSSLKDEDIAKEFPVGSSHTCCVLEFSSLDNMYIASFQQSVLSQPFVRIDQLSVGQVVSCELKAWKSAGAVVGIGLAKGFIPKLHFGELALKNPAVKFPVGQKFKARVCRIDIVKNQMMLTAKKRLVKSELPILSTFDECTYGTYSEGVVSKVTEYGINVYTIGGLPAFIPASRASLEDRARLTKLFFPGQIVQFHVVDANKKENRIILSMLFDESKLKLKPLRKGDGEGVEQVEGTKKKSKASVDESTSTVSSNGDTNATKRKKSGKKRAKLEESSPTKKSKPRNGQVEDGTEPPKKKKKIASEKEVKVKLEAPCLECPGDSFYDLSYTQKEANSDSELSGDESDTTSAKKKVKSRNTRKRKGEPAEVNPEVKEEDVEMKNGDPITSAKSVEDFEKLLLTSPNSSKVWCAYMTFVLQSADIENVRGIATRAIRTILFREETERENIWKLWLSMESTYGTEESLKNTFTEALKANDPLTIYQAMADIHGRNKNEKEQEKLVHIMTKKFPENRVVWLHAVSYYYNNEQLDKGRDVFKTSLEKLPKTEHILMISKAAVLEMKYGDIERGRTLLDTTLQTYPKRLDLWLLYTAQLIKKGEYNMAREVFENAVKVPFVPKRMLSILKKYLELEIEHGTPENRKKVKELALQYVNSMSDASSYFQDELDKLVDY